MTSAGRSLPEPGRLVSFVDAAVAIALTLLVLPLVDLVPEALAKGEPAAEVFTGNLDTLGSFFLGFAVIGRFWMVHHDLYGHATRLTRGLVTLNLLWVLTITVLPFLVEMVSSFGSAKVVLYLFVTNLLLSSALLMVMTLIVRRLEAGGDAGTGVPDEIVTGSVAITVNFALVLVVVLVVPAASYWALFLLFIDPLTTRVVRRIRSR